MPAGIGIDIHDPGVHAFTLPDGSKAYGSITRLCPRVCISPLHTHDDTGILHTESRSPVPNRLGEFFVEWGVRLTRRCVGYCRPTSIEIFVDGKRYRGDPRTILLTNHEEVAIVVGTPPKRIPSTADFSNAGAEPGSREARDTSPKTRATRVRRVASRNGEGGI